MKIILVAGGSGGHIYPCLELAKYLNEKDNEVLLCGSKNSFEEKVYLENGFNFKGVEIKKGFPHYFKNIKQISTIYREFKPDIIILFGNYISVSFAFASIRYHLPMYLHEQNVVYGKANKLLGIFAKRIYLSLPIEPNLYQKKSLLVGNPKSDVVVFPKYLSGSRKKIIISMGSLGSTTINEFLKDFLKNASERYEYHVVVGKRYYEDFLKDFSRRNNVHLYPYLDNLTSYLKSADLFISRSGATSISEIISLEVVSILIPSPYVANNHQLKNANYLVKNKAALIIEEKDLDSKSLLEMIEGILSDEKRRQEIKNNLRELQIKDTKKKIYEDLMSEKR